MLEGLNLHIHGLRTVMGKGKVDKRWLEITHARHPPGRLRRRHLLLPAARHGLRLHRRAAGRLRRLHGCVVRPEPQGHAACSPHDSKVDFLRRQVLTSRNIRGDWRMLTFMGGLNYQIEHHLFPNMPRPHLAKAQEIVQGVLPRPQHPLHRDRPRAELRASSSTTSTRSASRPRDPFDCPMTARFRTH